LENLCVELNERHFEFECPDFLLPSLYFLLTVNEMGNSVLVQVIVMQNMIKVTNFKELGSVKDFLCSYLDHVPV
jgi:hypothetical protein